MLTDEMRADGWIEHDGGPCPVPLDSKPAIVFADGSGRPGGLFTARFWFRTFWTHEAHPNNHIIAYKPERTDDNG